MSNKQLFTRVEQENASDSQMNQLINALRGISVFEKHVKRPLSKSHFRKLFLSGEASI